MSKIGKQSIIVPDNISIAILKNNIEVVGPLGKLNMLTKHVKVVVLNKTINVILEQKNSKYKKFHGLYRSLINNIIIGVSKGFTKTLILKGTGYNVSVSDNFLVFNLGLSHKVKKKIPLNIIVKIESQGQKMQIFGIEKVSVGLFAAKIRHLKKPDPYLGKGIRYIDEKIKYKLGKTKAK